MRSILITGGNGGLGRGIAEFFLAQDPECKVWLGVRTSRSEAQKLVGERCGLIDLEVTDGEGWKRAVETILSTDGRLDVLVNNAGSHDDHLLAAMPDEAWHGVIGANLDSVFLGCRAVARPMMTQRFGRIVNIASLSAIMPPIGQTNYAAAKAGVVALTRTLAKEVARSGITVNAVLPGYVETEALTGMDEEAKKLARVKIPMRRFGKPEDVAAAVFFLASRDASYITGASLKIDGGIY